MAIFYPEIEKILQGKVKPEPGELHLLYFLRDNLDDSYDVFFNPYMNGDRPDVVVMKKGQGMLIIEVKDYVLKHYDIDHKTKNWKVKSSTGNAVIKSPITQVLKYKNNLFDLHIENLLEQKISDIRNANMISCALYFHNATQSDLEDFIVNQFSSDKNYSKFLTFNILLFGRDGLTKDNFNSALRRRHLGKGQMTSYFPDELYERIKRFLNPPLHQKTDGIVPMYNQEQQRLIYDQDRKEIRVKGVVGSGKTTVLAGRAVELHKRTNGDVLILSFNVTLKNYLKDKISEVREEFPWGAFTILNYHVFINDVLNGVGVDVAVPENFDSYSAEQIENYFEQNYYSNIALFEQYKDQFRKFDAILIDEIQDYKSTWMNIIKDYFLSANGYYMVFGDEKQNIYGNEVVNKSMSVNIIGRPSELKTSYRSRTKIKELALNFQREFLAEKYETDEHVSFKASNSDGGLFSEKDDLSGTLSYMFLPSANSIPSLYTIIHENSINKGIHPNDITVLGTQIRLLKDFDAHYRYRSGEKTNTMFETSEMLLTSGMNSEQVPIKTMRTHCIRKGLELIKLYNEYNLTRGFRELASLLICKNLADESPEFFNARYQHLCRNSKITSEIFDNYYAQNQTALSSFIAKYVKNAAPSLMKLIRDNKKIHFWMNSGTIKISTIHSFKGWEADLVYLIIENVPEHMESTFNELIYTGITRAKQNLIILNYGNESFHNKITPLIDQVNNSN
ncbi:DNA-dependent helicase II [Chryseobacterium taklimakanense]|uniref:DNA 3'-5' helicase II n=1 Tax=Chryseobacterium taklimakanense TaxID=536441 RepID=A0A239WD18_9FLAO|nr:UvrD-helicase domain-containing protein [Chryseobacterium taklimakanense]SNV31980.1 DNA-dependent helicase II [Chryseobacterium taklimakanense]